MKFASVLALAAAAVAVDAVDFVPVLEVNYDFVGNDVANVAADKPDKCPDLCKANDKCHAYTWSDLNGGTCWLKSGRGAVLFKAGLTSAVLTPLPVASCQLLDGVDFVDNDLKNFPAASANLCCDQCKQLDKCRLYAWNNYNNGTCWLKSQLGTAIRKDGVQAGFAYGNDPVLPLIPNVDLVGHDVGNQKAAKVELCADLCAKFVGCRAYSWNNYQGGTCWFKASSATQKPKDGVTSGTITKAVATATVAADTDFYDNDFKSVPGITEAEDCVQICADTATCKAVVWSNYQGGTCWLKHQAGNKLSVVGAKAFVLN